MTNETPTMPFDHVLWNVTLTAFEWNESHDDWEDEEPLDKYELTFEHLHDALEYQRSWTTDAARTIIEEAGLPCLEVALHKQFYLTPSPDSFDGRLPFVVVTTYELDGESIKCEKYCDEDDIRSVRW
jgi:hypothetical protein